MHRSVQFWYTKETAELVGQEVVEAAAGGPIACIACPTLFCELRRNHPDIRCQLFEFDRRFEVNPASLPPHCCARAASRGNLLVQTAWSTILNGDPHDNPYRL